MAQDPNKKNEELDPNKVRLNSHQTSTTDATTSQTQNSTTTMKHGDVNTTQETYTTNPFLKDDGTEDTEAKEQFKQLYGNSINAQFHRDPETGKIIPQYLTDILGVDSERMKQLREQQMRQNEFKRRSANFFNSAAVIGDIITAARGGNVQAREALKQAGKAVEDDNKLKAEQIAADQALKAAEAKNEEDYQKAMREATDKYLAQFGKKVAKSKQTKGDDVSTSNGKTEGKNHSTTTVNGYTEQQNRTGTYVDEDGNVVSSRGKGNGKTRNLRIPQTIDGHDVSLNIPLSENEARDLQDFVITRYSRILSDTSKGNKARRETLEAVLNRFGLFDDNGNIDRTKDILNAGFIIDDREINTEVLRYVARATKDDAEFNKIVSQMGISTDGSDGIGSRERFLKQPTQTNSNGQGQGQKQGKQIDWGQQN